MMAQAPRPAGAIEVAKMVLYGLLGVRRKSDHEGVHIRPLQVIVGAVVLAALFIFALLTVVRIVLS